MRVAVVGAGPAGLSAASALIERGHTPVVFEKEAVVGGKCRSLDIDGVKYDLGANLTTPRYEALRPLAESLGLTLRELPERRIVNLTPEDLPSLKDASLVKKLAVRGGASYYALTRGLTGIDQHGYAGLKPGVRRPFREWLQAHGLGAVQEVFANLFVAYGYGVMDDLPAAYALKFFDPIHINTAVDVILGVEVSETRTFAEGFQALWDRLVERDRIDVRLEARITSIRRDPGGCTVAWTGADGEGHEDHFDALVLACPLDATLGFMDAAPEERRLFEQIRYNDYYVTATVLRDAVDISTFLYPYSRVFTPGQPTLFYAPIEDNPDDVFFFYAYGDEGTTVDDVQANIRAVMAEPEIGGELVEIIHTHHWRYFPHVSAEAMQAGFYDDLDGLQGRFNTWYVGELLSFSLVELIHNHARDVIARGF